MRAVAHQSMSSVSAAATRALGSVLATGELAETERVFFVSGNPWMSGLWKTLFLHPTALSGTLGPLGHPAVAVMQTIKIKQHHSRPGGLWRWDIAYPLVISMSLSIASLSC